MRKERKDVFQFGRASKNDPSLSAALNPFKIILRTSVGSSPGSRNTVTTVFTMTHSFIPSRTSQAENRKKKNTYW